MKIQSAETQFVRWLRANRDLSPNTVRAYASDIAVFRMHVGLSREVESLASDEIVTFVES